MANIALTTSIPGPRSLAMQQRKEATVAAGVSLTVPVYIAEANGALLTDVDGNRFIDLGSGIAVVSVGNSHPRVVEAVQQQVARFTHTAFGVTPYDGYIELCEVLAEITPGDFDKRTVLVNTGAEAVENAVKIARRYTGRNAVIVFDHSFHGRTNLTMAMTAKQSPYKDGFGPFAPEIYRMPMSYPFRDGGRSGAEVAEEVIARIENQVGADNVAAIVIEPIQGEGGFIVPAPGFLPALVEWAHEHDAVFVADEVQAGFARTGNMFACEHEGIVPDLITMAKGIGGGLPLAAVTGRAEIVNASQPGGLGGTYGGNPVSCAGLLTAKQASRIDVVLDDDWHSAVAAVWGVYQDMVAAYRREDRSGAKTAMRHVIDSLGAGVPEGLDELRTLGRTLKRRAADVLAYFDRPGTSNGPTEAICESGIGRSGTGWS